METPTKSIFEPLIGQDFVVTCDDVTTLPLTLIAVSALDTGAPATDIDGNPLRQTALQLTLRGPATPILPALTYPVVIPGHGTEHLFLSPFEAGQTAANYAIVFN